MFQTILNPYDVFCDVEKINRESVTKTGEFNNIKFDYLEIGSHRCLKNIQSTNPYDYLRILNGNSVNFSTQIQ